MTLGAHGLELEVGPGIHVQILHQAVVVAGREQQLQIHTPRPHDPRRLRPYHHLWSSRHGAGSDQGLRSFNFHKTDPARSRGAGVPHVAEGRDFDPVSPSHLQNRFPREKREFVPVDQDHVPGFHSVSFDLKVHKLIVSLELDGPEGDVEKSSFIGAVDQSFFGKRLYHRRLSFQEKSFFFKQGNSLRIQKDIDKTGNEN
jgi:hypothetical protein